MNKQTFNFLDKIFIC